MKLYGEYGFSAPDELYIDAMISAPPGGGDASSAARAIFRVEHVPPADPVQVTPDQDGPYGWPDWNPGWVDDLE